MTVSFSVYGQSFNWQSVAPGNYSNPVVMLNGGNSVTVSVLDAVAPILSVRDNKVPLLGSVSGGGFNSSVVFGNNRGLLWDFLTPLNSVTFLFGDGGGDDDGTVSIRAFDAANNLLGIETKFYGTSAVGDSLTLSFVDMDHFECTTDGISAPSSLSFEISASVAVPEPTTAALLSMAAAILLRRQKRDRSTSGIPAGSLVAPHQEAEELQVASVRTDQFQPEPARQLEALH